MSARSDVGGGDPWGVRGSRRRAPTPPPRDPAGINSIVGETTRGMGSVASRRRSGRHADPRYDSASSDSSTEDAPRGMEQRKRCSSYENVSGEELPGPGFFPGKPPAPTHATPRRSAASRSSPVEQPPFYRSTPSPSPRGLYPRASPCPSRHASPVRSPCELDDSADSGDPVRRRPPSVCKAPRGHRGSMPPADCAGWGHHGACGCCGGAPLRYHWCGNTTQSWGYCASHACNENYECEDVQQKICQLETEKEQLALQVNVLSEQVEAQNEKIMELENSLSRYKEQLSSSEALLRQEISSKSTIESSKLELMAQVSALRSRLAIIEHEHEETEERSSKLESELILTCACLAEKEADLATLKSRIARNGTISPVIENDYEVEKLKEALSSVMAANDEKEKKIQEMKTSLNRYKKLQELVYSNPSRRGKVPLSDDMLPNYTDSEFLQDFKTEMYLIDKPPVAPRQLPFYESYSRPSSRLGDITKQSSFLSPVSSESPLSHRINNSENSNSLPPKTPPGKRHYSTLPRPHGTNGFSLCRKSPVDSSISEALCSSQTSQSYHNLHHSSLEPFRHSHTKTSGLSFGKGFFKLRSGKRSSSAPELAPQDSLVTSDTSKMASTCSRTASPQPMLEIKDKPKRFKKLFGKIKRTGSENLNSSSAEFKRNGIRATSGPRLSWSRCFKTGVNNSRINKPFSEWDCNMISDWLINIGLDMYAMECKKWVKNGDQLLKATAHDFEKELGIKNPLHRKKLLLAITGAKEESGDALEPAGKIDHHWVVRWLDDVGLPQYKDNFFDARVDGRTLNYLTVEDLFHLKVTNQLHHISIKTGIQVLRENKFNAHCLKRRSLPNELNIPSEVAKWTNHRVMEWLCVVDLSEYAPNLRGSGVHGGLMVYEPRFNADLLATLLNIPPCKTLLRRHLNTQFKQLVGTDVMQKKREWEAQSSYMPLSPSTKVKAIRRSHFSLIRKKKSDLAFEDYVCPLNIPYNGSQSGSEDEKFLSKETFLKNETNLDNMPASNV